MNNSIINNNIKTNNDGVISIDYNQGGFVYYEDILMAQGLEMSRRFEATDALKNK